MFNLKSFFKKRLEIIAKSKGLTRLFAYGEMVCFPVSVGVLVIVAAHSLLVLSMPLLARAGIGIPVPMTLPSWFDAIFVAAAIGYLTNFIAIQMLYYPVDEADLKGDVDSISENAAREDTRPPSGENTVSEREALTKSRILSFVTLGFWKKGLIPQNKGKVARQMGRIAEEKFMTAENIAYLVPKLSALFLSKNSDGKIKGVEFVRQLAIKHKDEVAFLLQKMGREFVAGNNYRVVRDLLEKVGKSEAVSNALSSALFDYMEKNPENAVLFIREMVTGFTEANNRRTSKPEQSTGTLERIKANLKGGIRDAVNVAVQAVLDISYPQIKSFLENYAKDPQHRQQFRDRLSVLLPIFCDKIAATIDTKPQLLEQFFSGDSVSQLIHLDITDDGFWKTIEEKVVPGIHTAITSALESIPKEQFANAFTGNHHVAEIVERTIMNMKLLDFYAMLDDVMAEHLGAIQVFGFILGAAIGYVQYAVKVIAKGHSPFVYLLIAVPILFICCVKVCMMVVEKRR